MADPAPTPRFFADAAAWRAWLEANHESGAPLWVGLIKVGAARPGLGYDAALDEALCFGWIDGQRRTIDGETWMIRFSRRKPGSIWSRINLGHIERLKAEGRMRPAGLAVLDRRRPEREAVYAHENAPAELSAEYLRRFRADKAAWDWFSSRPPSYRKAAAYWVMTAKKEETRETRLSLLISESAAGRKPKALRPPGET